ncbi:Colicin V production protein [uncultured Ruminococcus sp.]|nr:CvpA family protein [uncultured Ruminococcus sp.]SCJ53049.1 Colicin V production protein [uncultured Ruminococcus sp.]
MVADIIIIAVFALLFFIDFKRGIAITILNVAGVALTGFLAYHISNFLASWVYTAFVQQTLTTNLQQMIDTQGINSAIANSFSALPNWVMGMLGFFLSIFGLDSSAYTNDFQVPNSAATAVSASVENLIQPVITGMFRLVIGVVISIIIFIIIKILVKKLARVFKIPVVKQINKLLGGVLGLAEAAILVFFAVNIFSGVLEFSNPEMLNNPMISGAVFKFFSVAV